MMSRSLQGTPRLITQAPEDEDPARAYAVRQDARGVIWCTCAGWVESGSEPRTCAHLAGLADDGLVPQVYRDVYADTPPADVVRDRPSPAEDSATFTAVLPFDVLKLVGLTSDDVLARATLTYSAARSVLAGSRTAFEAVRHSFERVPADRLSEAVRNDRAVALLALDQALGRRIAGIRPRSKNS